MTSAVLRGSGNSGRPFIGDCYPTPGWTILSADTIYWKQLTHRNGGADVFTRPYPRNPAAHALMALVAGGVLLSGCGKSVTLDYEPSSPTRPSAVHGRDCVFDEQGKDMYTFAAVLLVCNRTVADFDCDEGVVVQPGGEHEWQRERVEVACTAVPGMPYFSWDLRTHWSGFDKPQKPPSIQLRTISVVDREPRIDHYQGEVEFGQQLTWTLRNGWTVNVQGQPDTSHYGQVAAVTITQP